jgi:hypothetical protein
LTTFGALFVPEPVRAAVSDEAWLDAMLEAERALATAGARTGVVPADGAAAVAGVEELRLAGVEHLVFPATASWWLDHYAELRAHLEREHRELLVDESCRLYELGAVAR